MVLETKYTREMASVAQPASRMIVCITDGLVATIPHNLKKIKKNHCVVNVETKQQRLPAMLKSLLITTLSGKNHNPPWRDTYLYSNEECKGMHWWNQWINSLIPKCQTSCSCQYHSRTICINQFETRRNKHSFPVPTRQQKDQASEEPNSVITISSWDKFRSSCWFEMQIGKGKSRPFLCVWYWHGITIAFVYL